MKIARILPLVTRHSPGKKRNKSTDCNSRRTSTNSNLKMQLYAKREKNRKFWWTLVKREGGGNEICTWAGRKVNKDNKTEPVDHFHNVVTIAGDWRHATRRHGNTSDQQYRQTHTHACIMHEHCRCVFIFIGQRMMVTTSQVTIKSDKTQNIGRDYRVVVRAIFRILLAFYFVFVEF